MKGSHRAQSVTSVTMITTRKQPTTPAPTSTPRTSPTSSPLQQRTIPTMLAKEKEKDNPTMDPSLQIIQEALADIKALQTQAKTQSDTNKEEMKTYLQELRQEMKEMKDEIKKEIAEFRTELTEVKGNVVEMDGNIKVIQQKLQDSEKRIQVTEEKIQDVGQRVEEYEDHNYAARKDFDIAITNLELHSALHGLRFQNIEEEKDEDLPAKMAEVMGAILQLNPTELVKEIDEVYRVQTGYVKLSKLHVSFLDLQAITLGYKSFMYKDLNERKKYELSYVVFDMGNLDIRLGYKKVEEGDASQVKEFANKLEKKFEVKNLGEIKNYCGVEIQKLKNVVVFSVKGKKIEH
ncbi:tropomyosin-like [Erythrolamprus reginae]|uniref:tropomyosin-like n=1 Tax=Erythrolamprus reginae TaxID=121349 RepID=UPI00396C5A3A